VCGTHFFFSWSFISAGDLSSSEASMSSPILMSDSSRYAMELDRPVNDEK
jgi:hypothetical protein